MSDNKGPERLWTPWRMEYILDDNKPDGCIFCDKPQEKDDRKNLILFRGEKVFVIMNLYPYNNGHIMISPYSHVSDISLLNDEEMFELGREMKRGVKVLKDAIKPDGFNIGMNLGKAAGAGIDDHLHLHIVPRWSGDTNFMPVMSGVRVMPEYIDDTYMKLAPYYK